MKVLKMEVGMLGTNCYIAVNEATGHGVVVDRSGYRVYHSRQRYFGASQGLPQCNEQ